MELTTNLIKYGGGGNIWLVEKFNHYCLVSLDRGPGIKDLDQAKMKGFTSAHNSLGLGLYQLGQNSLFDLEIFTSTKENQSGTIVLVKPKKLDANITFLSKSYMNLDYNGDYYVSKGKYSLFGDVSGHGIRTQKSVKAIKEFFINEFVSCSSMNLFYNELHHLLKKNRLRSSVMCLLEIAKNKIQICGIGNINLFIQEGNHYKYNIFKNGIIGEVFDKSDLKEIKCGDITGSQKVILTTDGLSLQETKEFLEKLPHDISNILISIVLIHFLSNPLDDSSVLVVGKETII
jgi:hypothetical protein